MKFIRIREAAYNLPLNVPEFLARVQEMYEQVPKEFREKAEIELACYDDNPELRIEYQRPETEAEKAARIQDRKRELERAARYYERLKQELAGENSA